MPPNTSIFHDNDIMGLRPFQIQAEMFPTWLTRQFFCYQKFPLARNSNYGGVEWTSQRAADYFRPSFIKLEFVIVYSCLLHNFVVFH